jgi:hypothetical protein
MCEVEPRKLEEHYGTNWETKSASPITEETTHITPLKNESNLKIKEKEAYRQLAQG